MPATPDEPFRGSGNQLAMTGKKRAISTNMHRGAVQSGFVPFDDADGKMDFPFFRDFAETVKLW